MKNYLSIIILTCASILMQAQTSSGKHHIKYLEINTGNSDYSVDFIKDKVVFAAATSDKVSSNPKYQPHLDLFVGDMGSEGEILNKTRNRGIVTKSITKTGATFTKDGKTVYFSAKKYSKRKATKSKLFKATIDSLGNWINVERLSINKKNYSIEHPSLNKDETKLYVSANLPSTLGGKDIFVIDLNANGTLSEPKNIGNKINTIKDEITPFIADNNFMYFSSNGHNGIDNFDIYASEIFENTVSDPLHLDSPINSINNDFAYIVNPENSKGYFSSNRLQGQKNNDIYSFYIEPDKPKECLQQIVGTVRDKETENLIIDATISILDEEGKEIKTLKTDEKGNYRFELSCRSTYTVVATKQEYSKEEHIVNTASYFDPPPLEINQGLTKELKKVDEKIVININPIYFGFDKSYIRNEAKVELDRIVEVMQENPDLIIESASHTDSRGSKAYNQKLSERRAKATVDYIVSKGIDRARITAKGYGESQLINNCESGIPCNNDLHQLNRRTEFIVINKQVYYKSKEPPKKEEVSVVYEAVTNEGIKFSEKNLIKEIKNTAPVEENVSETTILNTSIVVVDNQEYEKTSSVENKEKIQKTYDDDGVDDLKQISKKDIINSYQTNQQTNNIKKYKEEASTDASSSLNEITIEKDITNSINSTSNADELIAGIYENSTETANNLSSTIKANNTNSVVDLTTMGVATDDNVNNVKESIDKPINKIRDIKKKPLTINDLKENDIILDEENNTIANFNKDLTNKKDNISSASNTLFNDDEDDLYAANSENVNNNDLIASKLTSTNTINKKNYTNEKEYKIGQFKEQYILSTKDLNKKEVLALNSINVSPISIKNNGKYIVTSNAKKVDVMRINFQINNNEYITPGHKEVYVLIQNPQGTILNRKGKFNVLNIGELTYTEKTNAYYNNDELNISMVTDRFIQKIIKGVYTILIYIEGYPVGLEMVELS